jgi:ATP adenylyltransferase
MNSKSKILLKKGTLWNNIIKTTELALSKGRLFPFPTDHEFIEDFRIRFFVRILMGLNLKDEARQKQKESSVYGNEVNPFIPYDKDLFVSDINETHLALLNKFNVVKNHLLIITRHFEDQETLLTLKDFESLWICMAEYNGLGFYNGGGVAGASQRHKHLQMVPLPLAPEGPSVPIQPLITKARFENNLGIIPGFPFLHVFVRLKDELVASPIDAAQTTFDLYSNMLSKAGLEAPDDKVLKTQSAPYCLLITRQWMLLVPRTSEFFESISINSLGFAGSLLVFNKEQMSLLKKEGPMKVLKSVAVSI